MTAFVLTDDYRDCLGLGGVFRNHSSVKHSAKERINGMIHTDGVESVWSVNKRGHIGTFHHFIMKRCQRHVGESAFLLDAGDVKIEAVDRIKFACAASAGKRLTRKGLIS